MGGSSAERDVSLSTGKQILNALDPNKYIVSAIDTATGNRLLPAAQTAAGRSLPVVSLTADVYALTPMDGGAAIEALPELSRVRSEDKPDVVFIALHGPGGEDGTVQGMLEVLRIPYTGSGVLASALAMDKVMSKRVLTGAGVLMPAGETVRRGRPIDWETLRALPMPVIVKPSAQGSTFGVTRVTDPDQLEAAVETAFEYDSAALIEQFVVGTEITVPVIGNTELDILPIVEIVPASGFYDFAAKYTPGATDEIVPARLSESIAAEARRIAALCHETLGCRGMSRTDMIVTEDGAIYTLETNTIPGMTTTSLLPRSAQAAGIAFPKLLDRLIELALEPR
jgi:D-alanine-D-alanine ligase